MLLVAAIAVGALISAVETHLARQGGPGGAAGQGNVKAGTCGSTCSTSAT
jgi:hypothetical protein